MKSYKVSLIIIILMFAGCATVPQVRQANSLSKLTTWRAEGVMSAVTPQRADIINFTWQQQGPQNFILELYGPLHMGDVQVVGRPGKVTWYRSEVAEQTARTAEALFTRIAGWPFPVSDLYYWVRGLPQPRFPSSSQFDRAGHRVELKQQGWVIQYSVFQNIAGLDLPSHMDLSYKNQLKIRVVIKSWSI